MPPAVTLIPRAEQRRMPWKNGGGACRELALHPAGAAEFDWRLSVAEVERDSEFSRFPGIDRSILVLSGGGFALLVGDDPPVRLRPGAPPFAFAGERVTRCVVAGGPSRDFNVMTRRGRCTHALLDLPLAGPISLERPPGLTWAAYLVEGAAEIDGQRVAPGDLAVIEPASQDRPPLALQGSGRVVLTRLARA